MDIKYTGNETLNSLVTLIKSLFIKASDVVDNCDSTSSSVPLSANQGKVLNAKIENKIDISDLPTEMENFELITTDDIDTICGTTIQVASADSSEVTF